MQQQTKPFDTTSLLWDHYYQVKVPFLQTTSEAYLRTFGMPTTGNRNVDSEVANSWITTMMPISKMVDHYKDGVQVRVCKESDTKQIYDSVSRHLEAWKTNLQHGINIGDAPIEDLIAMDEFANEVYAYAKYHFTKETAMSIMARNMSGVLSFTPNTFFKKGTASAGHLPSDKAGQVNSGTVRINPIADEQFPERDSIAGFLKDRLGSLKKWN